MLSTASWQLHVCLDSHLLETMNLSFGVVKSAFICVTGTAGRLSPHAEQQPAPATSYHQLFAHFCSAPRVASCSRLATPLCCRCSSCSLGGRSMDTDLNSVPGWLHLHPQKDEAVG